MNRVLVVAACGLALVAASAFAQTPAPRQAPATAPPTAPTTASAPVQPRTAAPAPPAQPPAKSQSINVRVDIDVTQKSGTAPAMKRSATIVTGDGLQGSIRSSSNLNGMANVAPLMVDARPTLLPDGKIRLVLNLNYETPPPMADQTTRDYSRANLTEGLQLVLDSGKSIVAAESPGPVGDVQFTVEVKATIIK